MTIKELLRSARGNVLAQGRISMDIAVKLMAYGCDVPALEQRLITQKEAA